MAEHAITHLSDCLRPLELKQRSLRAWKKDKERGEFEGEMKERKR